MLSDGSLGPHRVRCKHCLESREKHAWVEGDQYKCLWQPTEYEALLCAADCLWTPGYMYDVEKVKRYTIRGREVLCHRTCYRKLIGEPV